MTLCDLIGVENRQKSFAKEFIGIWSVLKGLTVVKRQ